MSRIIWVITPIVGGDFRADESLGSLGSPGTEIRQVHVERGPASIESEFDAALAAPWVVARAIEAQTAGAHAVVIDCMDDPGLEAAREAVSIPVLGPCQTTMHVAGLLGHRFSVVTTQARAVPGFENRAAWYGVRDRLASVRWVDIPVLDLAKDGDGLAARLAQESAAAVTRDGAHVVILGCTGMLGLAGGLAGELGRRGHPDVPVLDPIPVTIRFAEALADLGLAQSGRTYPPPDPKPIAGYDDLGAGPAHARSGR